MSKRKTGLGAGAFFQKPKINEQPTDPEPKKPEPEPEPPKPKKVRTTVTLYPETLALMEALKVEGRRVSGDKVTYSDILSEAIHDLADKWDVTV